MAEERNTANTVIKRFFPQGEVQNTSGVAAPYYYTRDLLNSIKEMCSSTGSVVAKYNYDPYGRVVLVSGSNLATFQYTGDYVHSLSGLNLTLFRAYDPNIGKWLSRDPIGVKGGINLYRYVGNNPITLTDPSGLAECKKCHCGVVGNPQYQTDITGFTWKVEFLDDDSHKPSCCKVEQFIKWNHNRPHKGFAPPDDTPNVWHEDRDVQGTRYGSPPYDESNFYNQNYYHGEDGPSGASGGHLGFSI